MADEKHWTVTPTGDLSPEALRELLDREGFVVEQHLDMIGLFTGRASDAVVERLRAIPGVTVEPALSFQHPDPDAPIT